MTESGTDDGVIVALVERFVNYRLPRAQRLKAKVDAGGVLDDSDIAFLERVLESAQDVKRMADRHPEYNELVTQVIHLYHEITTRALANERDR